ncbi:aspartate kinase [Carboxylicivirga sediminis]|uniref:Aspartokinase n=1 Tax=Carboxylicivirga sediminis TaxID=2006564 RepID=A0A941F1U9_9BACT|nr:aspartate kinase [Carboxylicivirga sediminis]MBR8534220.1 aspartate kinase [Carboxylicivirga sediminis]
MRVFKFGGASVKDAAGVKNLAQIIKRYADQLVVVVSAMGKTTNAMETIVEAYMNNQAVELAKRFNEVKVYHLQIVEELFGQDNACLQELFNQLELKLESEPSLNYDFEYDQIVPFGELMSTTIISTYLNETGMTNKWLDIRKYIRTDDCYRSANIDWPLTQELLSRKIKATDAPLVITQGFIGSTETNLTTTLGREGSDFTGAIIAHVLDAESLAIWKDVPGVLNADPRWYPRAVKIDELSYWEAIELTYYGAQVIHPKTLKPLQNKQIPLLVNSFIEPEKRGTVIQSSEQSGELQPIFVLKRNQVLISMSPKDFSFIIEESMSDIFHIFSEHRIKLNMMQTSALNFSVCVDDSKRLKAAIDELQIQFDVRYNEDMELVTIRHYTDAAIEEIIANKEVVDSQVSRKTARYVLKASEWQF